MTRATMADKEGCCSSKMLGAVPEINLSASQNGSRAPKQKIGGKWRILASQAGEISWWTASTSFQNGKKRQNIQPDGRTNIHVGCRPMYSKMKVTRTRNALTNI